MWAQGRHGLCVCQRGGGGMYSMVQIAFAPLPTGACLSARSLCLINALNKQFVQYQLSQRVSMGAPAKGLI